MSCLRKMHVHVCTGNLLIWVKRHLSIKFRFACWSVHRCIRIHVHVFLDSLSAWMGKLHSVVSLICGCKGFSREKSTGYTKNFLWCWKQHFWESYLKRVLGTCPRSLFRQVLLVYTTSLAVLNPHNEKNVGLWDLVLLGRNPILKKAVKNPAFVSMSTSAAPVLTGP